MAIYLHEGDSQVILYAKGHFEKTDNHYNDVRKIICIRNGIENISDVDLVRVLTSILNEIKAFTPYNISKLISTLVIQNPYHFMGKDNRTNVEKFIDFALSEFSNLQVKDKDKTLVYVCKPNSRYGTLKRNIAV